MDTKYVTLRIDLTARQAVSRLAYKLSSKANRRITQTEAIHAACQVAESHFDECAGMFGESEA